MSVDDPFLKGREFNSPEVVLHQNCVEGYAHKRAPDEFHEPESAHLGFQKKPPSQGLLSDTSLLEELEKRPDLASGRDQATVAKTRNVLQTAFCGSCWWWM